MTRHFSGAGKLAVLSFAMAAALAMPLGASARGWGGGHGYHGGGHGGYHGSYGGHGYYRGHGGYYGHGGGHWSGGRWIAGAIVTGAVLGLVADSLQPAPVYYGPPVYSQPRTVIYQDGPPIVQRRVVETRTVYDDQQTRYVRDDGYDGN
jgi:hypothetical protein